VTDPKKKAWHTYIRSFLLWTPVKKGFFELFGKQNSERAAVLMPPADMSWEFWCLNWLTCYRTHVPASMSNPGPLPSCLNKHSDCQTRPKDDKMLSWGLRWQIPALHEGRRLWDLLLKIWPQSPSNTSRVLLKEKNVPRRVRKSHEWNQEGAVLLLQLRPVQRRLLRPDRSFHITQPLPSSPCPQAQPPMTQQCCCQPWSSRAWSWGWRAELDWSGRCCSFISSKASLDDHFANLLFYSHSK